MKLVLILCIILCTPYASEGKYNGFLIDVGQKRVRIVGNSIEKPNEGTGNRQERPPERLGGLFSSVNDLPRSARIHRAVSRDPETKLGSLVAPSRLRTQSEGETLDLLLATHFPGSICAEGEVLPAPACRTNCLAWQVSAKIVSYRRVEWAIYSFAPYKIPGMDGIFPALLQEGREVLNPYLIRIFRACLATGYVPTIWRQVKVVFIPKPGRNSY